MTKNLGMVIGILGVVGVVGAGAAYMLMNKPSDTMVGPSPSPAAMVASPSPAVSPVVSASPAAAAESEDKMTPADEKAKVQVVQLEAGSYYFKPDTIKVKKGQRVKIVMKAADMMHDFNIDELDVSLPVVKAGSTGTVEFVADKVGSFEYYCAVGSHRANGQVGTLVVTE